MAEEEAPYTAAEVGDAVSAEYGELLDVNQVIIRKSRRQAERLEEIRDLYVEQISRLNDLIEMHIQLAMIISTSIGDTLAAEWDISDDAEEETEGEVEVDEEEEST